jgi:hypothetical protein
MFYFFFHSKDCVVPKEAIDSLLFMILTAEQVSPVGNQVNKGKGKFVFYMEVTQKSDGNPG